jgi:hypothetical protein
LKLLALVVVVARAGARGVAVKLARMSFYLAFVPLLLLGAGSAAYLAFLLIVNTALALTGHVPDTPWDREFRRECLVASVRLTAEVNGEGNVEQNTKYCVDERRRHWRDVPLGR